MTKSELEKALEAAEAKIAELEQSGSADSAGSVFVQWRASGDVPGGHVGPMWLSQDPPPAALESIPHVQVPRARFGRYMQVAINGGLDGEVRPFKTKGSAAVLQAPPGLLAALNEYAATYPDQCDGFLFKGRDGHPETSQELRERLHGYLDRLGIRQRGLHGFRHACALGMADQGVNPEVIRRAMRHSSLRVTAIYLSAAPEDIAAGLARGARRGA